jgi:hypothetical protein
VTPLERMGVDLAKAVLAKANAIEAETGHDPLRYEAGLASDLLREAIRTAKPHEVAG